MAMYVARGDGAPWPLRLLRVDDGALEAEEGAESEHEQRARAGREQDVARVERRGGRYRERVAVLHDDRDADDEQDRDLEGEQHAQHVGADVDAAVAEESDDRDRDDRPDGPVQVDAEQVRDGQVREETEHRVEAEAQRAVGGDRDEGHAETERLTEPRGRVRVERARVADVARHGGEADREEDEHDAAREHRSGGADAPDEECERGRAHRDGEGSCGRDDEEDDVEGTELALGERPGAFRLGRRCRELLIRSHEKLLCSPHRQGAETVAPNF